MPLESLKFVFLTILLAAGYTLTAVPGASVQQCGYSYNEIKKETINCVNYRSVSFNCPKSSCHTGGQNTPVNPSTSVQNNFYFEGCFSQDFGPKYDYVWPLHFVSVNGGDVVVMRGVGGRTLPPKEVYPINRNMTCAGKSSTSSNHQRPWCNQCRRS
ncbi:hypothetical protein O181_081063 [Austropuccinia psidii MF-1]|uniref:Secreted protein n=1 Tax=Austropuccinia psidii MF-1 TaxID=1389203 RepID=A0A9Q3FP41_9BASI|nr:hypothetical protein [Austropuccinia psidii MF-1]